MGESRYTIVSGDDWQGLYRDQVLVYEGHSIPQHVLADELGFEIRWVDDEWLLERTDLPAFLNQVQLQPEPEPLPE
jgi:hypothetical protein